MSALGLPTLPGMQHKDGESCDASGSQTARRSRIKNLTREQLTRIRGVDASKAPQELRCEIDGKLIGEALRSPHGHLFEKTSLERWIASCGSVCPVTGEPLTLDLCTHDREVERKVIEWAKNAKAADKGLKAQRRAAKAQRDVGSEDPDSMF